MNEPLVSIVIPFYNEEQFLERAVASAIGQTYANIEIILVNDGSEDRSLTIALKAETECLKIKVINAEHHSLGRARNLAIAVARGMYILFLDSDDELELTAVTKLVANIGSNQSDLVICKFDLYNSSLKRTDTLGWNVSGSNMDGLAAAKALYNRQIIFMSCARMYKMEIVRKNFFPEGLWFEDTPFLLSYVLNAEKISFEEASLWKIHSRPTSITRHVIEPKRIEDAYRIFLLELAILEKYSAFNEVKSTFFRYQIQPLLLNLIFLTSDRKRVSHLSELKLTFQNCAQGFIEQFTKSKTVIGPRAWLDLKLLTLNKIFGWKCTFLLLPFIKRKQFIAIHKLRNA